MPLYPRVQEVKAALSTLKGSLPNVQGRHGELLLGQVPQIEVGTDAEHTIVNLQNQNIIPNHPAITRLAGWFITLAFVLGGEDAPSMLSTYAGVVTESGQLLDYLHVDDVDYRVTLTVADSTCRVNPSTSVAPVTAYSAEAAARVEKYRGVSMSNIPFDVFLPQAPEGSIVEIAKGQYHAETTLPADSAKFFISAGYKY